MVLALGLETIHWKALRPSGHWGTLLEERLKDLGWFVSEETRERGI